MAEITNWVKKIWKNRTTEFPTRRTLMKEDGSSEIVTVTRNEGTVSEEGDAFDADTMNNLEERIDAGFTEVNGKLEKNSLGKSIDLSTYTKLNRYIIPSDGYIQARASSTLLTIMVAIEGKNDDSPTLYLSADWQADRYAANSIYVKKGMLVYMITSNGGASFYPLS